MNETKDVMQQALDALDSDSPDVQLRAAIALRQALDWERNRTWSQEHWTEYEKGIVAAEREKVAKWMIAKGYTTGLGKTIEDLLKELERQIK